jgi:chromosomal replication initiator protein
VNIPNYNTGNNKNPEATMPLNLNKNIKNPFIIPGLMKVNIDSQLNPIYNFESFVEGDCNRLGRSAGFAVSQKPGGTAFNPLVVYCGVGLGKSHLEQAIGNEV